MNMKPNGPPLLPFFALVGAGLGFALLVVLGAGGVISPWLAVGGVGWFLAALGWSRVTRVTFEALSIATKFTDLLVEVAAVAVENREAARRASYRAAALTDGQARMSGSPAKVRAELEAELRLAEAERLDELVERHRQAVP